MYLPNALFAILHTTLALCSFIADINKLLHVTHKIV